MLLICTTKLNVLVKNNEVDQLYFCYILFAFLSVAHDVDDINVDNVSCLPNNEHTLSSLSLKGHSLGLHSSKVNVSSISPLIDEKMQKLLYEYGDVFSADLPPCFSYRTIPSFSCSSNDSSHP